jgi:hypothetical protein
LPNVEAGFKPALFVLCGTAALGCVIPNVVGNPQNTDGAAIYLFLSFPQRNVTLVKTGAQIQSYFSGL